MTTTMQKETRVEAELSDLRVPYAKPDIQRVELALEETMSAGCKLSDTVCTNSFPAISDAGS